MQCPSCGHANAADANFCNQCGTALSGGAPPPTAVDDLTRYVPEALLERIRAAQAGHAMRGERRTVTMLFADLEGSTAAAERLDPEEWAEIVNGAFGRLIEPVYRYEGTLARLQGDAILAFFGAPLAHEDDPERAARAGLDILAGIAPYREEIEARYGIPIAVRVGINTGLVVVGEVGSDLRVEYTALGDAINVAARMEQTAQPGTVRVTADTAALLGDPFEVERIGPVEVKGKRDPVIAHRVVGVSDARSDPQAGGELVGRRRELDELEGMVQRVRQGSGGVGTIVGEAGIGKSRLLTALRARAGDTAGVASTWSQDGRIGWLQGRAEAYERSVPHAAFVGLLCRWWDDADRQDDCFGEVARAVAAATGAEDRDLAGLLTHLAGGALPDDQRTLIDSLDTPILHQRTTQAVADYLTAAARRRPLVLVLDDLHWADTLSLALVERLMDLTATEPLVLLLVMRPNQEDPAWRLVETAAHEHADRHTAVELESLDVGATAELLRRLLGGLELDEGLRTQVLDRAGGNPLFVEEIVHALSPTHSEDAGRVATDEISVPPSLTGLLTARLDRLDESARHLAQVASVIGREFDAEVLAAVADHDDDLEGQVEGLVRDGILERRGHRPRASFAFRHPLIRETAYSTVLLRTRRELHGRVARQLVDRDPEASAEIAHHFIDADEPAAAFPHLVAAGRTAVRSMALSDAIRFFSAALDHRPDDADPELVLAAHDGLGQAYALVPDLTHASAAYQSLLEFGKRSGRRHLEVAALNRLGFSTATLAADWDQAMAYLRSARIIAEEIHDEDGLAEYHMNACLVNALQGNFDTSVEHDTEVARIGETAGNETVRIVGLLRRTTNLVAGGRYDEAAAGFDDAWQAAREVQHEEALAVLECNGRAVLRLRDGDVAGAMELLRRHLPTLDRFASFYAASSHHWMAQTARLAGDVETALAAYAAAERLGRSVGQPHAVCAGMAGRAHVLARCGLTSDLGELRAEAEATVTTPAGEFYSSSTWTDLAGASLQLGELDRAERELSVALETSSMTTAWERPRILLDHARLALVRHEPADATGHLEAARGEIATKGLRVYEPELFVLDGMLATSEGRGADAITVLREAERAAAESGQQLVLVEALGRLADARDRAGDLGAARSLRERARSVVEEVAGRIVDEELRASLRARQFAGVGVVDPDAAGSG